MDKFFLQILNIVRKLKPILVEIINIGGTPYLVGGVVRDLVMNKAVKDIDIEVHKLSLEDLERCLKRFGKVKLVGKKFGVLRLAEFDIDWSLPRKDTKGRKPKVEIDPDMTIEQACKRRDLTMNAMAIDLKKIVDLEEELESGDWNKKIKIIDLYGGLKDIKDKKLKAVDRNLFLEDPLRFFRVMQFISRFEMEPDNKLNDICKNMELYDTESMSALAKERIYEEIKKLMLKSRRPSLGFRWLYNVGRLKEVFPELYDLVGVQQKKEYHSEGDVFEHTMQALDAAAILDKYEDEDEKFLIMLGILCHDLGKPLTTDKKLACIGHEKAGVPITKSFLKRITNDKYLIDAVCKLVLYHLRPAELIKQNACLKAYKRLSLKLAPQVTMRQVALVTLADVRGRNPKGPEPLKHVAPLYGNDEELFKLFLSKIKEANVEKGPEKPILLGRHLMDVIQPGPKMGELLKKAYEIQIEENIKDLEELKRRILSNK